jgi:hypothetical protein
MVAWLSRPNRGELTRRKGIDLFKPAEQFVCLCREFFGLND